ncbi:3'-5' exonuclease [Hydrogenophaga sp.]|uniref:3'-5' exonuclease n=1 Tax=Hydrogenophaga sp. TaxID=1904254 RepID=UPI00271ADC73|nr:ATP-dependent helicase [Hydrogenophaga sp.]MDO9434739.1 ATP-dependent helicase [Hydrogenophaga sp.]
MISGHAEPRAVFEPKAIQPTDEQLTIQCVTQRTVIVEANAGAAKTTTLALRMAESWRRGANPERFLALTFTQPACDALKGALSKVGVPSVVVARFRIQTFESFCEQVLLEIDGASVPVYNQDEQLRPFVWQAILRVEDNENERWPSELLMPTLGDSGVVEEFLKLATRLKGTLLDTLERGDNAVTPDYAAAIGVEYTQLKIFLAYERSRRRENADQPLFRGPWDATHDLARHLVEDGSVVELRAWPLDTQVLVVDEMHDLNHAMFRVLQELLNTTPSFFCGVGDFDQVLHEATGADAKFMGDFLEACTRRTVQRYPLTHSYRFGRSLAARAGRIAGKPYSSMAAHDTTLSFLPYDTPQACAGLVVQTARAWQAQPKTRMGEFAVLLRHSHQSVLIENALLEGDFAYTMKGFDSYLKRPEVLFVRGLLAVATDSLGSVADAATRKSVMEALVFFSGSKIEVEGREHESQEKLLADAIRSVQEAPGFLTYFFNNHVVRTAEPTMKKRLEAAVKVAREENGPMLLARLLDALDIQAVVRDVYVSRQRRQDALGNIEGLKQAAQRFATARDYFQSLNDIEQKQRQLKKPASLVIASIASVKGLEFDHVVLPCLEQGEFPASTSSGREEQNLFYVGMTRARRQLTLLSSSGNPSEFVGRMELNASIASKTP